MEITITDPAGGWGARSQTYKAVPKSGLSFTTIAILAVVAVIAIVLLYMWLKSIVIYLIIIALLVGLYLYLK